MSPSALKFLFSDPDLAVLGFTGDEGISRLYRFEIDLVAEGADVAFDRLVGKPAHLTIQGPGAPRHVYGLVSRFEIVTFQARWTQYHAVLEPPQIRLTLRRRLRVFQDMTTQQIVTQVLQEGQISVSSLIWSLKESYKPRNYCVQYRETDMNFIARLLEEEGIAYHFRHSESEVKTVFSDHQEALEPISGVVNLAYNSIGVQQASEESVSRFVFGQQLRSGKVQLRDYNFKKPRVPVEGKATGVEPTLEVYDYPGEFVEAGLGQRMATVRLQELECERQTGQGESNCVRFVPGFRFKLGVPKALPNGAGRHPRKALNQEYLLTRVLHEGSQPEVVEGSLALPSSYTNSLQVVPAAVTYRPARNTPRPVALGRHTATVVGPSGEDLYVDEFGRVKVRFHWDREKKNTHWVRVSQEWAGAGFGTMFLPRVGQEVLVSFLEADPDRPIVSGRVHNAEQAVGLSFPDNKTRSSARTSSSPPGSGSADESAGLSDAPRMNAGYNELRFEDKQGQEEIFIHAQKDNNVVVEHDRTTVVGRDRTESVGRDQLQVVENKRTLNVTRSSVHTSKTTTLHARSQIKIEVGQSSIVMTPEGITMKSNTINSFGDTLNDIKGSMIRLNCGPGGGGAMKMLRERPLDAVGSQISPKG